MNTQRNNQTAWIWSGALLSILLLASCGVTDPDESPWQDVRNFSWPTTTGTLMKYRTEEPDTVILKELTVENGADLNSVSTHNGQSMYVLADYSDGNWTVGEGLHYLPLQDTLFVANDLGGIEFALVSPLKKGQSWVAAYTAAKDTSVVAEIIELFSYRKVEGITYKNVVAVKYRTFAASASATKSEWIRLFAEGVGEIETIRNDYPQSTSSSEPLPERKQSTVLVETSFSTN